MQLDHELKQLRALAEICKRDYRARTRRVETTGVRPRQLRRFWDRLGAYAPLERCVYPPDVVHGELIEELRLEARDVPREELPTLARLLYFDGLTYFFTDESNPSDDDPPVLAFNDQFDAPLRVTSSFVEYAAGALLTLVLPVSLDRVVKRTPAAARRPLPACQPQLLKADDRVYLPFDVDPVAAEGRFYEVPLGREALQLFARRPEELAQEAFRFLVEDHGFELGKIHVSQWETAVVYTSPRARVSVNMDHLPLGVNVSLGLYEERAGRTLVDEHGLLHLVQDRAPDDAPGLIAEVGSLEQALALHSDLLRRHAADLLGGDLSRVPRLKGLRAAETRRRNKEEFGTSTGETPRFMGRPTLEELFADVTNEGLKAPRAYQAYWDYDYPLDEIARFLGVGERQVQALLDEWDHI
jgi:hypothetical protein